MACPMDPLQDESVQTAPHRRTLSTNGDDVCPQYSKRGLACHRLKRGFGVRKKEEEHNRDSPHRAYRTYTNRVRNLAWPSHSPLTLSCLAKRSISPRPREIPRRCSGRQVRTLVAAQGHFATALGIVLTFLPTSSNQAIMGITGQQSGLTCAARFVCHMSLAAWRPRPRSPPF